MDESAAFAFDTRDYLAGLAAESAVFGFDTRAVDGLSGAVVSYLVVRGLFGEAVAVTTSVAKLPVLAVYGLLAQWIALRSTPATVRP